MHHFFVEPWQIGEKEIRIEGKDVNHIRNVLRMTKGEEITVSGSDGRVYRCAVASVEESAVIADILWAEASGAELPSRIYLFQGIPKGDKMELVIQKAVELGAFELIPVSTKRTVVRLDARKEEAKNRRWNAIAESAAKQSKRALTPQVRHTMTFAQAAEYAAKTCDRCLIPYERAEGMERTRAIIQALRPGESIAVFIGPEGGFDAAEIELAKEKGMDAITLGRRILRTETAGMAVLAALMFQLETEAAVE